jgi:hypothetical protein
MTALSVRVFDETMGGARLERPHLVLVSERVRVRDILARRVEVDASAGETSPLVQRAREDQAADCAEQLALVLRAFARSRFLLLVDDQQATDLDQELLLTVESQLTFIKLVPLVGG